MSNFLIDEDTDLLAAEFVLGTLDAEERSRSHALLKSDPAFIAMVRIWERRFGELHLMVEPVEPDAKLWERIKSVATPTGPAAASELSASPDLQGAVAATVGAETAAPLGGAAGGTEPEGVGSTPAQASSVEEAARAAESAPPATLPPAPDLVVPAAAAIAGPDAHALETTIRSERAGQPPPKPASTDAVVDRSTPRRREVVAVDMVRSRDRWRAFGMLMVLLVAGLTGLLAAWKFMPDRLPARLRPAALMMSLGIDAPQATPARRPPPVSEFDE
jgi:hypothetical protein